MNEPVLETRRNRRSLLAAAGAAGATLSLLTIPVAAQSTPEAPEETLRSLSITGTGTVTVDPDTSDINFGVVAQNERLAIAQDDVSTRLAEITATLTDANVAEDDIVTSSYNVYPIPEYDRDGNYIGIDSFEVNAGLRVTVRDITQVGALLDQVVEAGANIVSSISFYVADTSGPASEARGLAITNARAKADEMALAAGVTIVGVIAMEETQAPTPEPMQYDMAPAAADSAERESVPISTGSSEIRVDVAIVYEISGGTT